MFMPFHPLLSLGDNTPETESGTGWGEPADREEALCSGTVAH